LYFHRGLINLASTEFRRLRIVTPPPFDGSGIAVPAHSLPEVHRSVAVPPASAGWARKLLAFAGPGYLVSVGYMDPGNWATALAGGSAFGYTLLTVALTSSLMAILLQALGARLGVATGRDLAQLCRESFHPAVSYPLWFLAEIAICATDLAELIGTAIALELLFGIPLLFGVLLTALDAFLILWLKQGRALAGSLHHGHAGVDLRLFRRPDRAVAAGMGGRGARLYSVFVHRHQPDAALHRHRHYRRHGDAA
jgi:hypothetical protein